MQHGYLILASLRRVLPITYDGHNEVNDMLDLLECSTLAHAFTFDTLDSLWAGDDVRHEMPEHWLHVRGMPVPIPDCALLVGALPTDDGTGSRPVMTIGEFQSIITFLTREEVQSRSGEWREAVRRYFASKKYPRPE